MSTTSDTDISVQPGGLPAERAIAARPRRPRFLKRDTLAAFLFLLPSLAHFVVFLGGLVVASFVISLLRWDFFNPPEFVGLRNYGKLLDDPVFRTVLVNTLYYTILVIPTGMGLSLLLALAVNTNLRGIRFFRTAYFIPVIASAAAVSILWGWVYSYDFGVLNWFLGLFGINPVNWLGDPTTAMPAVAAVQVWRGLGEGMIIFLAGLQAIPQHLYEASALDGASRWKQFRYVTWPLLSPTTFFVAVLEVIGSFQVFDMIWLMTKGGPGRSTTVYNYHLFVKTFRSYEAGYGAAMSWVLFAIIGVLTIIQFKVLNKRVQYELG